MREAEALVISVLRARGPPLTERDLPVEVQRAHRLGYSSKDRTEGMRQALLHYRAVIERMVGPEDGMRRDERPRREMAYSSFFLQRRRGHSRPYVVDGREPARPARGESRSRRSVPGRSR